MLDQTTNGLDKRFKAGDIVLCRISGKPPCIGLILSIKTNYWFKRGENRKWGTKYLVKIFSSNVEDHAWLNASDIESLQ